MKKLLLIISLTAITVMARGQTKKAHPRFWLYVVSFTTTEGCESSLRGTLETYNNTSLNYDVIKYYSAKYIYPKKLLKLYITGITEIQKSEMLIKSDTFHCEQSQSIKNYIFNNTTFLSPSTNQHDLIQIKQ